jgi:hypothetical protein|tara:strand:+ start:1985 stop:2215 length:231 start_codon:yes stop_codon:yes gene_type:complete
MEFVQHTCLYRIICRKRSDKIAYRSKDVVYWMPNRAGYTNERSEAGLYTALELDQCAGNGFDWLAERLSHREMGEL